VNLPGLCFLRRVKWQSARKITVSASSPYWRTVGWNYLKGRLRSHPDVAARWYQDLLQHQS